MAAEKIAGVGGDVLDAEALDDIGHATPDRDDGALDAPASDLRSRDAGARTLGSPPAAKRGHFVESEGE